jgi:hypothetical protein
MRACLSSHRAGGTTPTKDARDGQTEWKSCRDHRGAPPASASPRRSALEQGAFVFIFGRRQDALDAAVAEPGPNARAVKGSIANEADLDRLYAAVKAER